MITLPTPLSSVVVAFTIPQLPTLPSQRPQNIKFSAGADGCNNKV